MAPNSFDIKSFQFNPSTSLNKIFKNKSPLQ